MPAYNLISRFKIFPIFLLYYGLHIYSFHLNFTILFINFLFRNRLLQILYLEPKLLILFLELI